MRTNACAVALTFDDGPDPRFTPTVLSTLRRFSAHATFFVLGSLVDAHPGLVRAEIAGGDELANHGYKHLQLTDLGPAALAREVRQGAAAVVRVAGRSPKLFRPPYGALDADVIAAARDEGEAVVLWSVAPENPGRDGSGKRGAAARGRRVAQSALGLAGPGDIILLHDGGGNGFASTAALERLLRGLDRRGIKVVTVSELLSSGSAETTASAKARAAISPTSSTQDSRCRSRQASPDRSASLRGQVFDAPLAPLVKWAVGRILAAIPNGGGPWAGWRPPGASGGSGSYPSFSVHTPPTLAAVYPFTPPWRRLSHPRASPTPAIPSSDTPYPPDLV